MFQSSWMVIIFWPLIDGPECIRHWETVVGPSPNLFAGFLPRNHFTIKKGTTISVVTNLVPSVGHHGCRCVGACRLRLWRCAKHRDNTKHHYYGDKQSQNLFHLLSPSHRVCLAGKPIPLKVCNTIVANTSAKSTLDKSNPCINLISRHGPDQNPAHAKLIG